MLDGSGSVTFDVLTWLNEQKVPLVKIDWTSNAVTVISGDSFAANRDLRPKPLGRAPALARWGERGGIERTAASSKPVRSSVVRGCGRRPQRALLSRLAALGWIWSPRRTSPLRLYACRVSLKRICMDLKLKVKRALVTGGTAGVGAAIATGLAREGARVIVTGRSSGGVEKAVRDLKAESGGDLVDYPGTLGPLRGPRHWFAAIPTFALRPLAPARST